MNNKKQKLELTWIGKDEELKLEPRILIEDPSKSYGDPKAENMLIRGDNLLALKALEQDFTGRIKCIYIDPPYNTGSAWEHYDDSVEHSLWLNLMQPRLLLLQKLLREDGCIYLHIDNSEQAYLKVLCDEVFGRSNFITTFAVQVRHSDRMLKGDKDIHDVVEYILLYQKSNAFIISKRKKVAPEDEFEGYEYQVIEKGAGKHVRLGGKDCLLFQQGQFEIKKTQTNDQGLKKINIRGGLREGNSSGRFYVANIEERISEDGYGVLYKVPDMGDDGLGYRYFSAREKKEKKNGNYFQGRPKTRTASNLLPYPSYFNFQAEFNRVGYEGVVQFRNSKKPEKLIQTCFDIASVTKNDWVLDSFLGSGTTCAVAHKNEFHWVGIELGEHAETHCLPRLQAVVKGEDLEGVTEKLGWKGGGGFKFYNLAPSLLRKDSFGNFVIDEKYNSNMLAAAMCKHEGFKFYPDEALYWKHGKSTETDFIFVTTGFITAEQLNKIHSEMKDGESLLICAKSFAPECENRFANITIKKIPQMILGKCEFAKDNYDLNIIKATEAEAEESNED